MNIYAKSICKERVKMLKQCFDNVREKHPLVHNITNYVTVNDVANILLACGGSPIMADDSGEVEDITSICQGLNINIGTLNKNTIPSMFLAGKKANVLGHVVLLDPVGAGASGLRTKTANELVRDIKFTVIRGNISEIRTLIEGTGNTKGVDADLADAGRVATRGQMEVYRHGPVWGNWDGARSRTTRVVMPAGCAPL